MVPRQGCLWCNAFKDGRWPQALSDQCLSSTEARLKATPQGAGRLVETVELGSLLWVSGAVVCLDLRLSSQFARCWKGDAATHNSRPGQQRKDSFAYLPMIENLDDPQNMRLSTPRNTMFELSQPPPPPPSPATTNTRNPKPSVFIVEVM